MKANEILEAAEMFNTIFAALNECKKVNEANGYNSDLLFVECKGGTHYTNELGDIMPNDIDDKDNFFTCHGLKQTAAKFTEICLDCGCTPADIYTMY